MSPKASRRAKRCDDDVSKRKMMLTYATIVGLAGDKQSISPRLSRWMPLHTTSTSRRWQLRGCDAWLVISGSTSRRHCRLNIYLHTYLRVTSGDTEPCRSFHPYEGTHPSTPFINYMHLRVEVCNGDHPCLSLILESNVNSVIP